MQYGTNFSNAIWDSEIAWIDKADNTAIILRIYDDDEEE